jgi:hypothetical protein
MPCAFPPEAAAIGGTGRPPAPVSFDALVSRLLLCRTELSILQLGLRRISSSPGWTSDHQAHLEALEELLHREAAEARLAMAGARAMSITHLQTKAAEIKELCDPCATDLLNVLTLSLCEDVLALANSSFKSSVRE